MKERVYGWYPPAQDIYTAPRDRKTYQKECLFRHMESRYTDKEGVGTPQPPTSVKMSLSQRPERRSTSPQRPERRSTSPTRPATAATPKMSPAPTPPSHVKQVRIKSAPICLTPKSQTRAWSGMSGAVSLTPKPPTKAWSMYVPETKYSPIPGPFTPPENLFESRCKPERVQSATVRRDRVSPPKRPVKSAGPVRSPPTSGSQTTKVCRPRAPEPPRESPTHGYASPQESDAEPEPVDFDEQLDRFGWRMQVHGDPLQLKTPTFNKRLPYFVKCSFLPLPAKPPKVHMETNETFFFNTIPRKPATCVVHPEWISEVLCAKRLELQKRDGGVNYRYKNFSFVY